MGAVVKPLVVAIANSKTIYHHGVGRKDRLLPLCSVVRRCVRSSGQEVGFVTDPPAASSGDLRGDRGLVFGGFSYMERVVV